MKKFLFIFCLLSLFACGGDDNSDDDMMEEVTCPTEIQYAFRITVRNAMDNTLLEDVMIEAREQQFAEILVSESPGVYVGLEERAGTYNLIIEKEGFQTIVTTETSQEEDDCGLITQELAYELEPM